MCVVCTYVYLYAFASTSPLPPSPLRQKIKNAPLEVLPHVGVHAGGEHLALDEAQGDALARQRLGVRGREPVVECEERLPLSVGEAGRVAGEDAALISCWLRIGSAGACVVYTHVDLPKQQDTPTYN